METPQPWQASRYKEAIERYRSILGCQDTSNTDISNDSLLPNVKEVLTCRVRIGRSPSFHQDRQTIIEADPTTYENRSLSYTVVH